MQRHTAESDPTYLISHLHKLSQWSRHTRLGGGAYAALANPIILNIIRLRLFIRAHPARAVLMDRARPPMLRITLACLPLTPAPLPRPAAPRAPPGQARFRHYESDSTQRSNYSNGLVKQAVRRRAHGLARRARLAPAPPEVDPVLC
ncbi:hypothetical protein EVAR_104015_1 [Eumeta japonica]|uniref:Uncharacterized protein n=1 Tax=Eumeta variegata TaxID=151549 RepID=A0A4C1Y0X0_EUMVA|nr:hypothetical protein EVAR_104015_1 [Eumeta japonica]